MKVARNLAALCQRDQELAVVDLDLEPLESELEKSGVGNGDDLGIRQGGAGADDIGVALVELAVAAPLGTLGAPDFVYLVALERPAEILVHREHPGQRHGQVVAQVLSRAGRDQGIDRRGCRSLRRTCRRGSRRTRGPAWRGARSRTARTRRWRFE